MHVFALYYCVHLLLHDKFVLLMLCLLNTAVFFVVEEDWLLNIGIEERNDIFDRFFLQ